MNKIDLRQIPFLRFAQILKELKEELPKECTFLSPLKTTKGELQIRTVVNGTEYRFTTPDNLKFSNADIEKLHSSILEKC